MADPLSLLRQFNMAKREILTRGGYVLFGESCWPKTVNTNYRVSHAGKDAATKYYSLECLVFFLKNRDQNHSLYIKQANQENIPVVFRPDRNALLQYLDGVTQTSAAIDKGAPLEIPISKDELLRAEGLAASQSSGSVPGRHRAGPASGAGGDLGDDVHGGPSPAKIARTTTDGIQTARQAWHARLDSKKPLKTPGGEHPSSQLLTAHGSLGSAAAAAAGGSGSGQAKAITEQLTAEKIAALKAKRAAIKRGTIIDAEIELKSGSQAGGIGGSGAPSQEQSQSSTNLLIQYDAGFMKEVLSKERVWRNRTNILQATGKNFAKSIFPILQSVKNREDGSKRPHHTIPTPAQIPMRSIPPPASHHNQGQAAAGGQQPQQQPQAQYNRYDQERFARNDSNTHGFRIDTMGTYHGLTLKNVTEGSAQPAKVTPQTPSLNSQNNNSGGGATPNNRSGSSSKRISRTPIIILPAGNTALISMLNVKAILEELRYSDGKTERRETELLVQRRKPDGSSVPYRIIDNPMRLAEEDWQRVVAVFVQGPAWQFKGWPWGGNPVDIFANIRAFHLKWDELRLDANVAKWNVEVISLSRNRRHLDRAAFGKFWSLLDTFMAKNKAWLRS